MRCAECDGTGHTFALHDAGGAIKVGGGVSGTAHAVVLTELALERARRTADAAVGAGVVVVTGRTLHCRSKQQKHGIVGAILKILAVNGLKRLLVPSKLFLL